MQSYPTPVSFDSTEVLGILGEYRQSRTSEPACVIFSTQNFQQPFEGDDGDESKNLESSGHADSLDLCGRGSAYVTGDVNVAEEESKTETSFVYASGRKHHACAN